MKYVGKNGLKINGNEVWHEGNFDPDSIPTKLSQFENDIGAGAGLNIVCSATEPAGLNAGDWWYKEI